MRLNRLAWPRMLEWALVALGLGLVVWLTAPAPGQYDAALWRLALHKLCLAAAGGWMGYGLDRSTSPYARPDAFLGGGRDLVFASAMIRRAIIIGAAMIAVTLGG